MKKSYRIPMVLVAIMLVLSACKVNTPTAPAEPTPTNTVVATEAVVEATACPTPDPSEDLTLYDDNNKMVCTIYEGFFPELTAEQEASLAVFPEIGEEDWSIGPEDAALTILEYSDFQCPACASFYAELEKLMEKYPDDVRLVFRHFPLVSLHPNATLAAQASEAAGLQGKFWEMYDVLFSKQSDWSNLTTEELTTWLETQAGELELDKAQFSNDLTSETIVNKIAEDMDYGTNVIGLNSTPTILLNGRPWQYSYDASTIGMVIDVLKYEVDLMTDCPPWVIDQEKEYTATIETEKGDIVIDLFPKEAPLTVNSFVYLAQKGFYDGVTFHRVQHDFVAQAGDPSGTGISGAGYEFRDEISSDLTFGEAGMVGMANAGEDTNGSQFFITYVPTTQLNCSYTIFGKVTEGMDVLNQLTERDTSTNPDAPAGDKIITITIEEK